MTFTADTVTIIATLAALNIGLIAWLRAIVAQLDPATE